MEICLKVGSKRHSDDPLFYMSARDGHILHIDDNGFGWGRLDRSHHVVLRFIDDYATLRGSTDLKSTKQSVLDFNKYTSFVDSSLSYKSELSTASIRVYQPIKYREFFIDFKWLVDNRHISKTQYEDIYNRDVDPGIINIPISFINAVKQESIVNRLDEKKNMAETSGSFTIGSGAEDYATIPAAYADIDAAGMDGNLTFTHSNEETAVSADHQVTEDLGGFELKLTPATAHNGGAYGNGARANWATFREIEFATGANSGTITIERMAFDLSGSTNVGVFCSNVDAATVNIKKCLMKGDSDTLYGIEVLGSNTTFNIFNNIIYEIGDGGTDSGIYFRDQFTGDNGTVNCYNNTLISNYINLRSLNGIGTWNVKNNIAQNAGANDYEGGGNWDTTGVNIAEDTTSPDNSYDSKDLHTNSVFIDYANDDYRLDSGGDSTNLAIVDDGEDLSGTFTEDIQSQTRSTWYAGASEIISAAGLDIPIAMHHYTKNIGS